MNASTQMCLVLPFFLYGLGLALDLGQVGGVDSSFNSSGCDPALVHWSVHKDAWSSFHWQKPDCHPMLKHFGGNGDAAMLLDGREVLLVGNSNVRILTNTLYHLVGRGIKEKAVVVVPLAGHSIPDVLTDIWPKHGVGVADFKRDSSDGGLVKTSSKECHNDEAVFPQCILNPCVTKKPQNRTRLSYAYTSISDMPTNAELLFHAWQSEPTFAPDFVVIQLYPGEHPGEAIVEKLDILLEAVPALCDSTIFLLLTQTQVGNIEGNTTEFYTKEDLVRHEDDVRQSVEVRGRACLRHVPVSRGTYYGMLHHALHHEAKSNWHFLDPGRYYLAQAVLNAMQQALSIRHDTAHNTTSKKRQK
jgi:hypothetical protein